MSDDRNRLPITEAAQKWGVSIDTVRRRIKSGEVDAQRDNAGKWWVFVPDASESSPPPPQARPVKTGMAPAFIPRVDPQADLGAELIKRLVLENERLWEMLKSKDALIRDLALRDPAQDRAHAEHDTAREQLRQLKHLVALMLEKAKPEKDGPDAG